MTKTSKYIFYAIFILSVMIMSKYGLILSIIDDSFFSTALDRYTSALDYAIKAYFSSSGRFIVNTLMVEALSYNIWVWRILNAAFFTLMIFGMYLVTLNRKKQESDAKSNLILYFLFLTIFISNWASLRWSAFWVVGSFNYLWTLAAMFVATYPFIKITYERDYSIQAGRNLIALIPCVILASSHEQTGIALGIIIFGAILYKILLYKSPKIGFGGMILLLVFIAVLISVIFAPGNFNRLAIADNYLKFTELNLFEKLFYGYNWTVLYNIFINNYAISSISFVLVAFIIFKERKNKYIKFLALIPVIYELIYLLCNIKGQNFAKSLHLFNFEAVSKQALSGISVAPFSFFIGSVILLIFITTLIIIFYKKTYGFSVLILYIAGIYSALLVSFSPTIYLSGPRIFFASNMLYTVVTAYLFGYALVYICAGFANIIGTLLK